MRVYRSPLRLFAFGLIGLILVVASVEVMFGHWISEEPENTDGVLTTRGQAQQRGDIVWGAAMVGVGTLLVGTSVIELVRRRPLVAMGAEGVMFAIGSHDADVVIPWSDVESITSDVVIDVYDGSRREVLLVTLNDRSGLPDDPIGATWDGDVLAVDAHDWTRSVTDVALAAQGALGHHRRLAEIHEMGPPSVVWDDADDDADDPGGVDVAATGSVATAVDDSSKDERVSGDVGIEEVDES